METVITWKIIDIERELSDGYAFNVSWEAYAQEEDLSARAYGSVILNRPEDEFIPFENLTEEIVISWVKYAIDRDKQGLSSPKTVEEYLIEQIELQKNPPTATGTPW
jgi:hypothetical protein